MSKNLSIELVGAGIALLIIFALTALIIALSKKRRARRAAKKANFVSEGSSSTNKGEISSESVSAPSVTNATKATEVQIQTESEPEKSWSVSGFLLQTEPLGNIPGTGAERELIVASALALARAAELRSSTKSMWGTIVHRYQQEFADPKHLELIGLEESAEGFAARVSFSNKKYTVLLGEAGPVALASAPFSPELRVLLSENESNQNYVLVIDGIAYSAISLK